MKINNKLLLENSKNLSVLYVEDDLELRKATLKLFSNFFKNIDSAQDGKHGLEAYKTKFESTGSVYDIVISDINMPNMNGIEMCKAIKEMSSEQAIIFLTAFNEVEYLKSAIELGVHDFLCKAVEMKNLKEVFYTVTQMVVDKKLLEKHYEQIEELSMLHIDTKDARGFSSSKDILKNLEKNKEMISKIWVEKEFVQERLGSYLIDLKVFRTDYAMKVIEHILGVIRGDEESGSSPAIFIMLDFLKNKDMPLKDIFMICVLFKNTISSYIFEHYSFNQVLFDDISSILDRNLGGVIINYLELNYTKVVQKSHAIEKPKTEVTKAAIQWNEDISHPKYIQEDDMYKLKDREEDIDILAIAVTESSNILVSDLYALGNQIKRYGNILINYTIFAELGAYVVRLGMNFAENAQALFDDKERMVHFSSLIEGFVNDLIIWRSEVLNNIEDPDFLNQSFFSNVDTIIMFMNYDKSVVGEEYDPQGLLLKS